MARIYFVLLGCDKNTIDAEIMASTLIDSGHEIVGDIETADCAVVNTCGFIESAKTEAVESVFDMVREKQSGKLKAVVVTGCLAQRYTHEVRELIPEVDAVIGLAHNADISQVVEQVLAGSKPELFGEPEGLAINGKRLVSTPQHYAYIKIAEGCSNRCTYCAIPKIRGRYRSRPKAEIIDEARDLAGRGVRELIVIAQDTTSYGADLSPHENISGLLRDLCEIEGLWKIRLLYAYPDKIDDALIDVMSAQPKIAKYIDIPMQHCDAGVLRRMGRFGDEHTLLELIKKLRDAVPEITIRSTFIVGFSGESDEQFSRLLGFVQKARLDRAGCFAFSPEEGTPAEKLDGLTDEETRSRRAEQFMAAQTLIMEAKLKAMIGKTLEIICDGFDEEAGFFACRSEHDAPEIDTCIYLPLECDLVPGELYDAVITSAENGDLYGELWGG